MPFDDVKDKFAEEKRFILEQARDGIKSNIPLSSFQKKYVKNLLFFSLIKALANETVTPKNFIKLVNKIFKKILFQIFKRQIPDMDEEYFDENMEIELNNLIAREQMFNLEMLSNALQAKNIVAEIKKISEGLSSREVIKKIINLRQAKENQRETPDEARKREQRIRQYERQRQRANMRYRGIERQRTRS